MAYELKMVVSLLSSLASQSLVDYVILLHQFDSDTFDKDVYCC